MRSFNQRLDCPKCGNPQLVTRATPTAFTDFIGASCTACRHVIRCSDIIIRMGQSMNAQRSRLVLVRNSPHAANEEQF